jgi:beta-phosphoglucomutase-like phosphatase (HAD superfamily)
MNETRAIIFDMDGVLTDSEWFIAEAARLMFKENFGVEAAHGDFTPFVGHGENRFLGGVAEKYQLKDFDIERDKEKTYEIYIKLIKDKLKALPGSVQFVFRCRELGIKTALATSSDSIKMTASLEAIGLINTQIRADEIGLAAALGSAARNNAFDAMVNGLDVERHKPFPDLFIEAAKRLEEEPGRCWVIEDSIGGVKAAKAAKMRCLALLTTFPQEDLLAAGADRIAKDLSAISPEELM